MTPSKRRSRVQMSFLLLSMWCVLGLYVSATNAAEVEGLFSAEVEVPAQTDEARDAGIKSALSTVLLKLTGDRQIASRAQVAPLLGKAEKIVQQYRFRDKPSDQEGMPAAHHLWAAFDGAAIMTFLQDAQIPVWGRSRPSVLVWAVVEEDGARMILDPDVRVSAKAAMDARANARGLPMVYPLWDLDDQRALSSGDVWGNFTETIQRASVRYRTNAILVGRVFKRGRADWNGRWTLYDTNGRFDWETSSSSADDALAAGVDATADNMTKRYAQVMSTGAGEQLIFIITGVDSVTKYGKAVQHLEGLDAVARLRVMTVQDTVLKLQLQLRGNRNGLAQMIALGDVMAPQQESSLLATSLGAGDMASNQQEPATPTLVYRMLQ